MKWLPANPRRRGSVQDRWRQLTGHAAGYSVPKSCESSPLELIGSAHGTRRQGYKRGMGTPLLTEEELHTALADLSDWTRTGDSIARTVQAASFPAGIDLVGRVAAAAEEANHHPDIDIRWRKVTFTLSTHSEGGLTARDVAFAKRIDQLAQQD